MATQKQKSFTIPEVIDIVTKNIMQAFGVSKELASNRRSVLGRDIEITSLGMLNLIINLWEDLGLDIKTIPARRVGTVEDIIDLAMDALDDVKRLSLKLNMKGPGPYILRGKHR